MNFELDTNEFSNDIENELFLSQLTPDYKQYYDMITSIVLGEYEQTIEDEIFMVDKKYRTVFVKIQNLLRNFC